MKRDETNNEQEKSLSPKKNEFDARFCNHLHTHANFIFLTQLKQLRNIIFRILPLSHRRRSVISLDALFKL